jgi:beta-lactam-binding protein with PASTA domain
VWRFLGWGFKWSLAAVLIACMMGVAGLYVFNTALAGGEYVTVPDITGLPVPTAMLILAEAGLDAGRQTPIESDQAPPQHVVAQRPAADQVVRAGRKVYPTVSMGARRVQSPNVMFTRLEKARELLDRNGMREGAISRIPHDAEADTVIAQEPPPDAWVGRGAAINLLVSEGRGTGGSRFMPEIVGRSPAEVVELLENLGLRGVALEPADTSVPLDRILEQDPPPGTLIEPGHVVTYMVRRSGRTDEQPRLREVRVDYTVPAEMAAPTVQIDIVNKEGVRHTWFPAQTVEGGKRITGPVYIGDEVTIEFRVDGRRHLTYFYRGDADPVITNHLQAIGTGT